MIRHLLVEVPRWHWRGWRTIALWGLAVVALSRAFVYLPVRIPKRDVPAAIDTITRGTPLTVTGWGALWLITGLALAVLALTTRNVQRYAMVAMVAVGAASAGAYLLSWAFLFPPDNGEWSGGLLYFGYTLALLGFMKEDDRVVAPPPPKE